MPFAAVSVTVTHWLVEFVLVKVYASNWRDPVVAVNPGAVFGLAQDEATPLRVKRPVCCPEVEV